MIIHDTSHYGKYSYRYYVQVSAPPNNEIFIEEINSTNYTIEADIEVNTT